MMMKRRKVKYNFCIVLFKVITLYILIHVHVAHFIKVIESDEARKKSLSKGNIHIYIN